MASSSKVFDVVLFFLASLVTGPITGSGIMTIFFDFLTIDQKSVNRKYRRLSFAQYLEIGAS